MLTNLRITCRRFLDEWDRNCTTVGSTRAPEFHSEIYRRDLDNGVDVPTVLESAKGNGALLHAKPSVWGQMATDAGVGTLVLSHLSGVDPRNADDDLQGFGEKLAHLRSGYEGPLLIAEDLMCIPMGGSDQ